LLQPFEPDVGNPTEGRKDVQSKKNTEKTNFLILIPLIFIVIFLYYPVFNLAKNAFFDKNGFTLDYFRKVFTEPYNFRIFTFTVKEAFISALFTLIIGFPGAYIVSHYNFPGKKLIMSFSTIPFVLPSVLVSLGFIILFGRSGVINNFFSQIFQKEVDLHLIYSFSGIILVHSFYNFPVVVRIIGSSWEGISEDYIKAAKSLGASNLRVFFTVTLPMIVPSIVSSFSLVFIFCFLSFAIILILGGVQFATIEVAIYMYYNTFSDFRTGSALAIIQVLILLFFVFLYIKAENFFNKGFLKRGFINYRKWGKLSITFSSLYLIVIVALIFAPISVVVVNAFLDPYSKNLTVNNISALFLGKFSYVTSISTAKIVVNSLFFAIATVLLSVTLALIGSYFIKKRPKSKVYLLSIFMGALVISPLTIALSYALTFQRLINSEINGLFIILSHTIVAFPFVLRAILPVVESTSDTFVLAARSLGMKRLEAFLHVDLNLLKLPLISSSIFAFAISMGEFGATVMLYQVKNTTIPIALYRFLSGRHFGIAAAFGALLLVISLIAFFAIDFVNSKTRAI